MYYFLNSALNTELVYVILQGISVMNKCSHSIISAFGDVTCMDELKNFRQLPNGNAKLTLDHFILYDVDQWGTYAKQRQSGNIEQDEYIKSQDGGIRCDTDVDILFYRFQSFADLFDLYNLDMSQVEESLNPELNKEQVF